VALQLGDNQLAGHVPPSVGNLVHLQNFSVGFNPSLTGVVPDWLCGLRNLEYLLLESTGIGGQIPRCIGNMTTLRYLDMRELLLTGTLPAELFEPPSMEYLLLSGARFTGGIPATLSPAVASTTTLLRLLTLTSCGLSGEIPQWLADMPNLTAVELSGNDLTGPIPTFPMGAPLVQFSAANNRLTGTLEPCATPLA